MKNNDIIFDRSVAIKYCFFLFLFILIYTKLYNVAVCLSLAVVRGVEGKFIQDVELYLKIQKYTLYTTFTRYIFNAIAFSVCVHCMHFFLELSGMTK